MPITNVCQSLYAAMQHSCMSCSYCNAVLSAVVVQQSDLPCLSDVGLQGASSATHEAVIHGAVIALANSVGAAAFASLGPTALEQLQAAVSVSDAPHVMHVPTEADERIMAESHGRESLQQVSPLLLFPQQRRRS